MLSLIIACSTAPETASVVDACPSYSGLGAPGSWRRWEQDDGSRMETMVSARHMNRLGFEDLLVDTVLETDDARIDLHVVARCDEQGMHHLGAEVTTSSDGEVVLNDVALGELVLPHDVGLGDELPDGGLVVGSGTQPAGDLLVDALEVHYEQTGAACSDTTVWLNSELGMVRSEGDPDCDGETDVTELVRFGD
ncbi:MAG TPA: hypothetical protein QGF58_09200 [Myxococcota bacterium]|nr:hypothetical protein [Myxococcota bacterium]